MREPTLLTITSELLREQEQMSYLPAQGVGLRGPCADPLPLAEV